jgi:lipid-A-disaccharide synthase
MKKRQPELSFFGIGGDGMVSENTETVYHAREMSFLGFIEVLKHLPFIRRVFRRMVSLLKERKPGLVILIDYPGFNLRFAKVAKKQEIPVLYYISPQVWAWGKRRVKKIAKTVDRMLVIFPFESNFYEKEDLDVRFVGHPLKDIVRTQQTKESFLSGLGLDPQKPTVGLLPGSREQEVRRLLPEMIKAFRLLKNDIPDLQAVLSLAPMVSNRVYESLLVEIESIRPVEDETYEVMAHSDAVMVASGTATLETAILGTPMVVLYKMSLLSYLIGRALVRVKNIGLVNIVAGHTIVPELIQGRAQADKIARALLPFLTDEKNRIRVKHDLADVSKKLGDKGASARAAESVLDFMNIKKRY